MSSLALAHLTREAAAGGEDAWRALVALLVVAVAGVSYHYLEVPARAKARRWADGLAKSRTAADTPIATIQDRVVLEGAGAGAAPQTGRRGSAT